MEVFLIRLLQFMLAISLLVLLHEGGHFLASKLFGVRVEKFYLFFDPWFHIFEFKPKHSDTTYGIGWLPLGGYCKISGMIDESFDTEQMNHAPEKWEFRSKPSWQRLIIMVAGVFVNFITALFIYAMVLFHWGDNYVAVKDMTLGMEFNKEAKALGFQNHDILLGTDKGTFKDFNADMYRNLAESHRCDIIRNGRHMSIALPGDLNLLGMLKTKPQFVRWFAPSLVDSTMAGSPAEKIGLQKNDSVIEFNGRKIDSFNGFQNEIGRIKDVLASAETPADSLKALTTTIAFVHKGDTTVIKSPVTLAKDVTIGAYFYNVLADYKMTHVDYSFLGSLPAGVKYGWDVLKGYVDDFKYVFTADGAKSLGGFGAIGSLFPPTWDWHTFWLMTAFLSIILAFMNILPIPALDGGHAFFLCYEMITKRKPSDKFMIRAEYVGISILLLLMVVANMNDILRWLGYM